MPSPYKTASNELIQWILTTSGVDLSQEVTVNEIIELARGISTRHPPTPLPEPIHDRFKSVIYLRSAANRFWSRAELLNPSEEIRASNTAHRIFIDALQEAFDLLAGDGSVTEAKLDAQSPTFERENLFSCLTVYATEDTESEHPPDEPPVPRPIGTAEATEERKRKKKQRSKTKDSGKSTQFQKTHGEARRAALRFMRQLESLRKFIADTWIEVANGQLNTAVAGALSLAATRIVEELQDDISTEFEQCGSFRDMMDLISPSAADPENSELSCTDSYRALVRFIDACRKRSRYLLESPLGTDDANSQYCLLAMVDEFGCPQKIGKFGPSKLVHQIIALVLLGGPAHFTKRLRPDTVFEFQVVLDSIAAAQDSQHQVSDPPHLAHLRRFQSRFIKTESVLQMRLRERQVEHDLDLLEILRSAVEGLGMTRVWKLCPWICGVGLALAVDAVENYGTQLWTQSGIPLMMFHFYNILRQHNTIEDNAFLDSLWTVCGGRVPMHQRRLHQQAVPLPDGAIRFIQYERRPGRISRQGIAKSPIWRTKLDRFNTASPFASLAAAGWNPLSVAGKNWAPRGKVDLRRDSGSVLARIKVELLLDITGPVPVAGLDLLLVLLAFDMFFKDVFWTEISDEWSRHREEEPVFGDFHDVVFRWVMSTRDDENLGMLLSSIGESFSQNLESMHMSVFRYFQEADGTGGRCM